VSTNYATLACTEFPTCGGKLVPEMDFEHGFHLWRELGKTAAGHYLPFSALTAIHWVHRNFAFVVLLLAGYAAWRLEPGRHDPAGARHRGSAGAADGQRPGHHLPQLSAGDRGAA
jgi:heme A synthase